MAAEAPALRRDDDHSEERLLIAAAQLDRRRFADLYEEHFERVYAYVLRRVRHREEAEDLTSETFQRALSNIDRFEWRGAPFSAWLFRIAANAIHNRRQRAQLDSAPPELPADEPTPEQIEERAQIFRWVGDLPADQREVVVLRFGEQRSLREVAAALQRSEGAVKQLQFRALNSLRARLDESNG